MTDEQFTMDEGLEELVVKSINSMNLYRNTENNPSENNTNVRRQSANFYENSTFLATSPAALLELANNAKKSTLKNLDDKLDDNTYKNAKLFYSKGLDKEVLNQYYINLIKEGIIPEKPNDKLRQVIESISVADDIINALQNNDTTKADAAANEYFNDLQKKNVLLSSLYNQGESQKKKVLANIAKAQHAQAMSILEKENLYGELDKAILESEYGKAISLSSLYSAYGAQQKINEKKKAEAEKAKKGNR